MANLIRIPVFLYFPHIAIAHIRFEFLVEFYFFSVKSDVQSIQILVEIWVCLCHSS